MRCRSQGASLRRQGHAAAGRQEGTHTKTSERSGPMIASAGAVSLKGEEVFVGVL